jgi:hypothetical protein
LGLLRLLDSVVVRGRGLDFGGIGGEGDHGLGRGVGHANDGRVALFAHLIHRFRQHGSATVADLGFNANFVSRRGRV